MKKLVTFLAAALTAVLVQAQPTPAQGVGRIIAGTNITITPTSGTGGAVTINSTGGGLGTVTSVSVATANGVSGTVATDTTTPVITLTLGAITPSSISIGADPADAGDIRLVNAGIIGWEASPAGTDVTLSVNSSEQFVFSNSILSPTLITPALGVATATSLNGNTFTTGTYTLTGTAAKTLTFTNSLTLSGTDGVVMTTPTTSFTAARTDAANTFTGTQTFAKIIASEFFTTPVTGTTGTTNALTVGEIIYFATFVNGTTTTLTLPVAPALGDNFFVWINGANGSATLTTSATVYRVGDSSSGTVLTPNQVAAANAKHKLTFTFDGTNWWYNDTFSAALNLAGSGTVTGLLPAANGGTALNSSASTGVAQVAAGTWTVSTTLPSGLTIPAPIFSTGFTASGSGANTLAGSSGTFITSTGLNTLSGATTLAPTARATGIASYWTVTTPADTNMTASTESIGANWAAATRQWATGALTTQREHVYAAPTYGFVGASTLTTAVNVDIADPIAGTNATLTNKYGLRVNNQQVTGTLTANTGTNLFGPFVDSVDGSTPLNNINQVVATGTAYTMTNAYGSLDFGTTDPILTIANAGTYAVFVDVQLNLVGATYATYDSATIKLRRTNNTAADLAGSTFGTFIPTITTITAVGPYLHVGPIKYTTTNTNDTITVQGILGTTPAAGSVTATACTITAIRAY